MKKIIIFTVHSGGGHISATQALQDYLQNDYEIKVFNFFKEVIPWADPVGVFTLHRFTLDEGYNFLVRKKYNRLINLIAKIGIFVYPLFHVFVKKMILNQLKKNKADIIISVIPVVNGSIEFAAQQLNMPFLIVTTDLDTTWFTKFLPKKTDQKRIFTLSFDDPMLWEKLENTNLSKNEIFITGYPLRKSFFETKDKNQIKKELSIPESKLILMILMGGIGSNAILTYLQYIKNFKKTLHIFACIGKNDPLRKQIEKIKLPEHISISIIGFTNKIADLMTISDLIITKSGSTSICEALYLDLPLLLDGIDTVLDWERFNHTFVKTHNFGATITNYENIIPLLATFLENDAYRLKIKKNIEKYPKLFFGQRIEYLLKLTLC